MRISRRLRTPQAGFTLIEVIVSLVVGAIMGVILLSYMGTQLIHSGDPVNIARAEGAAEMWMERIISDYVKEMNAATCVTALATIYTRTVNGTYYNMPASVTLTRTYVTYDAAGTEVPISSPGTSTNLKVTVQAGGYGLTSILTAERVTCSGQYSDPVTYY
jgi:prepilin-type N-terminal cleavage/methylation domain-containing protein